MEIRIQAIKFDATEKLEAYINKKLAKLQKLEEDIQSIDVYLKVVKPETSKNKEAEIKVMIPNAEFFSSKVCDTFEESIDTAIDALDKQIIKHKEKSRTK